MYTKRMMLVIVACSLIAVSGLIAETGNREVATFSIQAERYRFVPEVLKLPANTPVQIQLKSRDALHGFNIPSLGIRHDLFPGQSVIVSLPALKPGRYPFLCDIFCGSGHSSMQAEILVQ